MATTEEEADTAARMGRPVSEFPDPRFPTLYADGIASLTPGPGMMRMFFYRSDPNALGRGGIVNNPVLQVAMPMHGFAQMALFVRKQLDLLVEQNQFPHEMVAQIEAELAAVKANPAVQSEPNK